MSLHVLHINMDRDPIYFSNHAKLFNMVATLWMEEHQVSYMANEKFQQTFSH